MKFTRRKKLPVVLEPIDAEKLLKMPNKRYLTGIRNKAIMLVMLNMGLRVSEITNLRPGSINITSRKLRVVNGKGGVDRDLVIPDGIIETLRQWKSRKPRNTKYFFTTLKGKQLSTRYLCEMIKRSFLLAFSQNMFISPLVEITGRSPAAGGASEQQNSSQNLLSFVWSGWMDLSHRPQRPESYALATLRYIPIKQLYILSTLNKILKK